MLRGERTERRKARKLERDEKESAAQNKPRRGVFFFLSSFRYYSAVPFVFSYSLPHDPWLPGDPAARVINVNHGSLLRVGGRDFAKLLTLCKTKKKKKEKSLNLLKERKPPFLFLDFVFARRNFRPCWYFPPPSLLQIRVTSSLVIYRL